MSERWLWLETGLGDPAWNMALDEALLITAEARGVGVVRVYGWRKPAATFGYSQRYREVEGLTALRPLIRRPTGGGVVPHDRDWTYSIIVPPGSPWHRLQARESYRRVHLWVAGALGRVGLKGTLATEHRELLPGVCFVGAVAGDVLVEGHKVAGAAQRRNRLGLLIQGSVQARGAVVGRGWFEGALREAGQEQWGGIWRTAAVPDGVLERAVQLMETKYGCEAYQRAR